MHEIYPKRLSDEAVIDVLENLKKPENAGTRMVSAMRFRSPQQQEQAKRSWPPLSLRPYSTGMMALTSTATPGRRDLV